MGVILQQAIQRTTNSGSTFLGSQSLAFATGNTAGKTLLYRTTCAGNITTNTVADTANTGGNAPVRKLRYYDAGAGATFEWWAVDVCAGGANTVTFTSSSNYLQLEIHELSGTTGVGCVDVTNSGSSGGASSTAPAVSLAVAGGGEAVFVVAAGSNGAWTTLTQPSGYTLSTNDLTNGVGSAYKLSEASGMLTPTFTITSDIWGAVGIAIKAATTPTTKPNIFTGMFDAALDLLRSIGATVAAAVRKGTAASSPPSRPPSMVQREDVSMLVQLLSATVLSAALRTPSVSSAPRRAPIVVAAPYPDALSLAAATRLAARIVVTAPGAITVTATAYSNGVAASPATATFNAPVAIGQELSVGVIVANVTTGAATGFSDQLGNTFVPTTSDFDMTVTNSFLQLYTCKVTVAGTPTLSFAHTFGTVEVTITGKALVGADPTNPVRGMGVLAGAYRNSPSSTSTVTVQIGDFIHGVMRSNGSTTTGANGCSVVDSAATYNIVLQKITTAAGADFASAAMSAADNTHMLMQVIAAAPGIGGGGAADASSITLVPFDTAGAMTAMQSAVPEYLAGPLFIDAPQTPVAPILVGSDTADAFRLLAPVAPSVLRAGRGSGPALPPELALTVVARDDVPLVLTAAQGAAAILRAGVGNPPAVPGAPPELAITVVGADTTALVALLAASVAVRPAPPAVASSAVPPELAISVASTEDVVSRATALPITIAGALRVSPRLIAAPIIGGDGALPTLLLGGAMPITMNAVGDGMTGPGLSPTVIGRFLVNALRRLRQLRIRRMATLPAFDKKRSAELEPFVFDLYNELPPGESIASAVFAVKVASSSSVADPTPTAMLYGSASVAGTKVYQRITGGVNGCLYVLSARVTTAPSAFVLEPAALLLVQDDGS